MPLKLNHCRDSGASGFGSTQGGMPRSEANKATCPTCGKRVQVTRDGRLFPHGTYQDTRELAIDALLSAFDAVAYSPRPNYWVLYAASSFPHLRTEDPREAAAAVLDYFANTDYQPTTNPQTIVRITLRRAS